MGAYTPFTATDAIELAQTTELQGEVSKGQVIDIIRSTAKQKKYSVVVPGMSVETKESLNKEHEFVIEGDKISWEPDPEESDVTTEK